MKNLLLVCGFLSLSLAACNGGGGGSSGSGGGGGGGNGDGIIYPKGVCLSDNASSFNPVLNPTANYFTTTYAANGLPNTPFTFGFQQITENSNPYTYVSSAGTTYSNSSQLPTGTCYSLIIQERGISTELNEKQMNLTNCNVTESNQILHFKADYSITNQSITPLSEPVIKNGKIDFNCSLKPVV